MIFAPVTSPHVWRQVDTMGVSLRYARRFIVEATNMPFWLPAILNSGDSDGVMPMEFPLLNLFGALGFVSAGRDVDLGRSLAQAILTLLVLVCVYIGWRVWRSVDDAPKGMTEISLLVGFCSFATPFTFKFMPDVLALLLCFIGTAGVWRGRVWSILPLALGLLMKPTAGVVCALLLLHPFTWKALVKQFWLVGFSLVAPLVWYLKVIPYLKTFVQGEGWFQFHEGINPWQGVADFWTSLDVLDTLQFHGFFPVGTGLLILFAAAYAFRSRSMFLLKLIGIVLIQASLVGALSGVHARLHAYYLIGLVPTFLLLIWSLWHLSPNKWVRAVIALALISKTLEASYADSSGLWNQKQAATLFKECADMRAAVPDAPWFQGKVWRTPRFEFPLIDFCLGERGQSLTSEWGAVRRDATLPDGCASVWQGRQLVLIRCSTQPQ
jgi:hypothetical protein